MTENEAGSAGGRNQTGNQPCELAVTFTSCGETLAGRLHMPAFGTGSAPAVAIVGPMTFCKEQSPTEYARRLAQLGYSALALSAAARLTKPWLMIHSDQSAIPDAARRHHAVSPAPAKRMLWQGQTRHLQYYDDPAVLDQAACEIASWFATHLGAAAPTGVA